MTRTLLLTRALHQANDFAKRVEQITDFQCHIAPMQEMQDIPVDLNFSGVDALVFTSKNGVESFARRWTIRDIPAFCVGPATAEIANSAGMTAYAASGNSVLLAELVNTSDMQNPLHIHGLYQTGKLAIKGNNIAIYEQAALPLDATTSGLLADGGVNAIALFSPRSAALLAAIWLKNWPETDFFCISEATAVPVKKFGNVHISREPSAESMLEILQL